MENLNCILITNMFPFHIGDGENDGDKNSPQSKRSKDKPDTMQQKH